MKGQLKLPYLASNIYSPLKDGLEPNRYILHFDSSSQIVGLSLSQLGTQKPHSAACLLLYFKLCICSNKACLRHSPVQFIKTAHRKLSRVPL